MKLITNRHRNIALLVKQGRTYLHILTIASTGVEAARLTEDELTNDWSEVVGYPNHKAVASFRDWARTNGMTEGARALLVDAEALLAAELTETLETLVAA